MSIKTINVDHRSDSELGRQLSSMYFQPWTHPVYRNFTSLEGFWWWVKSGMQDDQFRYMHPTQCRLRGTRLYRDTQVDDFAVIVMKANYFRIANEPDLLDAIVASIEPFDLFYKDANGKSIRPPPSKWIIPGWEYIRHCLRDNLPWSDADYRELIAS